MAPPTGAIRQFRGVLPTVAPDAFVAPGAVLIGDVTIGAASSIWFGCVLRGDIASIRVGARVNVQDGTVVHVSQFKPGTEIGDDVSIGHMALIHACVLEPGSFVGMSAVVMDEAVVESGGMLAAGALLTPGKRVPRGELWAGRPARRLRFLTDDDKEMMRGTGERYVALSARYRTEWAE